MVAQLISVLSSLNQAGIRAKRGTLNEKAIKPDSPVAVVYPEKSTAQELVMAVEIFGTQAVQCEDVAYEAVAVLNGIRGNCTVEQCQFSGKTGLFSVKILARWPRELAQKVYLDGVQITNLTAFHADATCEVFKMDSGDIVQTEWCWDLTIEELLAAGKTPEAAFADAHTVKVVTAGGTETYSNCHWLSVTRRGDSRGTLQTRKLRCWNRTTE